MASPILSIEKHDIALADAEFSTTVTLSVGDVLDCSPRISYRAQNSIVTHPDLIVRAKFLTSPNRLEVSRLNDTGPITIRAVVIEWDTSSDVSIETGSEAMTGATADVTVGTIDLDKTFATISYETLVDNDQSMIRGMLTTTTNLHLERDNTTSSTANVDWWVVEDVSSGGIWDVQRVEALTLTGATADATITSVDEATTMLLSSQESISGGVEPDEWGVTFLADDTTVTGLRVASNANMIIDAFVVEFTSAAGVEVQRGNIVMGSGTETNTATVTAVADLTRSFSQAPMVPNGCSSDGSTLLNSAFAYNDMTDDETVEASVADDSTIETVYFEVIEFLADTGATQHPVAVGANF